MKKTIIYSVLVGLTTALIWWMLTSTTGQPASGVSSSATGMQAFFEQLDHNKTHPLARLMMQIIVILITARTLGYLCRLIGQPSVIGEILAGIFLGPSLIGTFFPEFSAAVFPAESLGNLQVLSQVGLILFMFVIGMELEMDSLRRSASEALLVSHISIAGAFAAGVGLSFYLYSTYITPTAPNVSFVSFALFMGVAMSIAAFPVLARILQERGWSKTPLGAFIIACAAIDDFTAWSLLAMVIAIVKAGSVSSAFITILIATIYVLAMLFGVRPLLARVGKIYISKENISRPVMAFLFLLLIGSAYCTEIIGIHALFGAFMAGICMPQNSTFKAVVSEKIEDIALILFLPLFFVFTGLRTQIGLLNEFSLWVVCGVIIAVATVGKMGSTTLGAKLMGKTWGESLRIGALMNTRGLMELVVLNIGFDLGILTPTVFAMMVIMALTTTFMTGPLLSLIIFFFPDKKKSQVKDAHLYRILLSFGPAAMGAQLLRLSQLFSKGRHDTTLTALHITPRSDISRAEARIFEKEGFLPIFQTAEKMNVSVKPRYKASGEVAGTILDTVAEEEPNLLLMGGAKSLFDSNVLGGIIKDVSSRVSCPVGIFIDKTGLPNHVKDILWVKRSPDDHTLDQFKASFELKEINIHVWDLSQNSITMPEQINDCDLIISHVDCWEDFADSEVFTTPISIILIKI